MKKKILLFLFFFHIQFSIHALEMPFGEIVRISNMKENQITGFGIVVGLSRTGDRRSPFSDTAMRRFLQNSGMEINEKTIASRNIAAVMVMAKVKPMSRKGDLLDIWISSIGDAESLNGGYLLQTPLKGADGKIYAVAQAPVSGSSETDKNGKNTIYVSGGAIMEREILSSVFSDGKVHFSLRNFDFNTARNSVEAINKKFQSSAVISESGEIIVTIPADTDTYQFLSDVMLIPVQVYTSNRVIIDSASGTIIMGGDVGISSVAVTLDGLTIQVSEKEKSFHQEDKKEASGSMYIKETAKVSELVEHLNKLGLSVDEIIHIIKGIDKAGALHGELIII